jgi:hypothetical protein
MIIDPLFSVTAMIDRVALSENVTHLPTKKSRFARLDAGKKMTAPPKRPTPFFQFSSEN